MNVFVGKNKEYSLSESAITHIINGNFSQRQDKDSQGNTILTKVISGGLHTLAAWYSFVKTRTNIKSSFIFEPSNNEKWYYIRRLQNDVLLLKIPRECYQSKAANLTQYPETFYKSGYLWKTLFPSHFSKQDIIDTIDRALQNQDTEETSGNLIIGYSINEDPIKTIKIRIQLRGNEILSAFPTWGQPRTGNNGKPYSHMDAINTIISGSTIILDNEREDQIMQVSTWCENTLEKGNSFLPKLILKRAIPLNEKALRKFQKGRMKKLVEYGKRLSQDNAIVLYNTAVQDAYIRYPFEIIRYFYENFYDQHRDSKQTINTFDIYNNFHDILCILNGWDLSHSGRYAIDIIYRLLEVRFIRTGGVDQWELKRLLRTIFTVILSYKRNNITVEFLRKLAKSPSRYAFYHEFNLNTFFIKDPGVIGVDGGGFHPLNETHFYKYASRLLGINYSATFTDKSLNDHVKSIQIRDTYNGDLIVKRSAKNANDTDFKLLIGELSIILKTIPLTKESIKTIDSIIYDYKRCLAANIQIIIASNCPTLCNKLEFGDPGYYEYVKAKHEYQYFEILFKAGIEDIAKSFKTSGFTQESQQFKLNHYGIMKEVKKIPMPKGVPEFESFYDN